MWPDRLSNPGTLESDVLPTAPRGLVSPVLLYTNAFIKKVHNAAKNCYISALLTYNDRCNFLMSLLCENKDEYARNICIPVMYQLVSNIEIACTQEIVTKLKKYDIVTRGPKGPEPLT